MSEEILPTRTYLYTYIALIALLSLTMGMAFVPTGRHGGNLIAIAIACTKATCIALFFMHLKYGARLLWFVAGTGVFYLGIMLVLTGAEYYGRNHPPGINPKGEPVYLLPRQPQSPAGG